MADIRLPRLLTLREASQILHVHANTLRNWERQGLVKPIRIGTRRDRRFTAQSLQHIYQQQNNHTE